MTDKKTEMSKGIELGKEVFDVAMKTIGYEVASVKGRPALSIEMSNWRLFAALNVVTEQTYLMMLMVAIRAAPEKETLTEAIKFHESFSKHLREITMKTVGMVLDDEAEDKAKVANDE